MRSAGLLPYRIEDDLEVLLAHPGGPYYVRRDIGAWSVVKGEVKPDETDEHAAIREFKEETGWNIPSVPWVPLGETVLKSRKRVIVWALEHAFELPSFAPGTFSLHGREYPEVDRVEWMTSSKARQRLNPAQTVFIDRLEIYLGLNRPQRRSP